MAALSVALNRTAAAAGSPLEMTYRFTVGADAPSLADGYVVFVHFMDEAGGRLWADDHQPPTPTSRWKAGDTIEYTRTVFVPKFSYTGRTDVHVGLYVPGSGERLPLAAEDTGLRAYRVATFEMTSEPPGVFVVFRDGWHDIEVSEDGTLEWQWSRREGTISFRNPKRDAELLLLLDQPVQGLAQPQQVEVRLGSTIADTFALPVGVSELRRVALPALLLGESETVEMTIAVDRTFVPAAVPSLRSADARELGIRVFRAYVEPK